MKNFSQKIYSIYLFTFILCICSAPFVLILSTIEILLKSEFLCFMSIFIVLFFYRLCYIPDEFKKIKISFYIVTILSGIFLIYENEEKTFATVLLIFNCLWIYINTKQHK